jgi:hypothetical protein
MFRKPDYFTKPVHGGIVALRALLSTGAASATGLTVDKLAVVAGKHFQGVLLELPVQVLLDSGQSQTVALTLNDSSASGGTYASFATGSTVFTNSTTVTGVTVRGVAALAVNLIGAKQWVRANVVFTGSASDTGGDQDASNFTLNFVGPNESPA